MPVHPDRSGQVSDHGYDDATRTIAVKFRHGKGDIYHYPDQPRALYEAFIAAESMGIFHAKHIKNLPFRKYRPEAEVEQPRGRPIEAPHGN